MRKARKGLIRVEADVDEEGVLRGIVLSGDFFVYPEDAVIDVEARLVGLKGEESIKRTLLEHFNKYVEYMPGVSVDDFIDTVVCAYRRAMGAS